MIYIKYRTDGTAELLKCPRPLSLKALQGHVNGYVEFVRVFDDMVLCVNDCGRVKERNRSFPMLGGDVVLGLSETYRHGDFVGFDDNGLVLEEGRVTIRKVNGQWLSIEIPKRAR